MFSEPLHSGYKTRIHSPIASLVWELVHLTWSHEPRCLLALSELVFPRKGINNPQKGGLLNIGYIPSCSSRGARC